MDEDIWSVSYVELEFHPCGAHLALLLHPEYDDMIIIGEMRISGWDDECLTSPPTLLLLTYSFAFVVLIHLSEPQESGLGQLSSTSVRSHYPRYFPLEFWAMH